MQIPSTAIQTPALASGLTVLHDETLTADTASFDVQNIPQGYKHLQFVLTGRTTVSGTIEDIYMRFNNDSGASNYHSYEAFFTNSENLVDSYADAQGYVGALTGNNAPASYAGQVEGLIANYAGTTFFKSSRSTWYTSTAVAAVGQYHGGSSISWLNTSAINRVQIFPNASNFLAGSRLTVYGLGGTISDEVPLLTGVRLKRDANQSCGTSAETPIPFDEVDVLDTNNFHDIVTENTKIIIPPGHAGYYDLRGEFSYQSGATGQRAGYLKHNNVTYVATVAGPGVATIGPTMQLVALGVYLGVGDYIQLVMWHNQGGAQNVTGSKLEAILRGHA